METRNFRALLEKLWARGLFVCVGLDTRMDRIPGHQIKLIPEKDLDGGQDNTDVENTIFAYNCAIVDATHDLVCAYKPNVAFYEAEGEAGIRALRRTIQYIHAVAPDVPVILDAKRADIGSTNEGYVRAAFDELGADAITVHPYLGAEAMRPFLDRADKGVIVLCRTSNPGAGEFQDLLVSGKPLYRAVARQVTDEWNSNGNCAVVVGATYPEELAMVRAVVGDMPILIPGIGAQGGDVEKTVRAGQDERGMGMIINSSRGVIFASSGEDFAKAARAEVGRLNNLINSFRF